MAGVTRWGEGSVAGWRVMFTVLLSRARQSGKIVTIKILFIRSLPNKMATDRKLSSAGNRLSSISVITVTEQHYLHNIRRLQTYRFFQILFNLGLDSYIKEPGRTDY
jgi:hypothetical protein